MNPPDKVVEATARAIARAADADYWTDEIDEWEAQDEWEKEAYEGSSYPASAYEDRDDYRLQARAAIKAAHRFIAAHALHDVADVMEAQPIVDMTSVAYLRGRANALDPT